MSESEVRVVIDGYRDLVRVGSGGFSMVYRAFSKSQHKVVAEGDSVIVMIDPKTGTKVPLDEDLRARVSALEKL